MKGLLKYLSPFAPDQSGAASVLYDMGGLTIICDAGGCTGNICGFDEPRWFIRKSAIFSAGLRDMDAILGRDDKMVEKIQSAAGKLDASFAALIGTPVPAVIATDYRALERMAEKRCHLPILTVECTGTRLYDEGEAETWLALFRKFAGQEEQTAGVQKGTVGVIGMTPLNISRAEADGMIRGKLAAQGYGTALCYGMRDGLEVVKKAGTAEKNIVVSPSGLKAARYLKEQFGTPYEMRYPFLDEGLLEKLRAQKSGKVLVIHQQAAANEIRREIRQAGEADVTVGTWFLLDEEYREEQDVRIATEEELASLVMEGGYDLVVGDEMLRLALRDYRGQWLHVPHFAVSGELEDR